MARKRTGNGRRQDRKRSSSRPDREDRQPTPQADRITGSSSRLLLTRLLREGALWEVYVATTAADRGAPIVRLEFERRGGDREPLRHTRRLSGALLESLHGGSPVDRAELERELEKAIQEAAPEGGASETD